MILLMQNSTKCKQICGDGKRIGVAWGRTGGAEAGEEGWNLGDDDVSTILIVMTV